VNEAELSRLVYISAQLRHAYQQLIRGDVKNQVAFARGLLGPQIERLERMCREQQHLDSEGRGEDGKGHR
jgi:hypothetical protein